ncbi:MAG: NAD-dependent DNA ligase LigA [Halobacteriales archaeon]
MVDEPEDNPYVRDPPLSFEDPEALHEREAREQVALLREAIEYHDRRYYVRDDPVISDRAYDALFDRLQALEAEFGLDDPNSPTRRVGGEPLDELETVEHVAPMLSLDSSDDAADVRAFDERVREAVGGVDYSVEPKFDGFSIEVVYEGGELDRAVTRGDGEVGEDVTANVRTIHAVPLHLPEDAPERLAVRGEIYMPRSGFQRLNERRVADGEDPFKNPRNAAAGTVRQLDPSVVADRPLSAYFYDVLAASADPDSQRDAFDLLERVGLRVNEHTRVVDDVEAVIEYRNEMLDRRPDLEYEIDGVVAKVDDYAARERLGETAAHPRWAYAYKFPPRTDRTTVRKIAVQVGRTGKLTPVALVDPVDVGGVTVSRASLHNETQVRELGVADGAGVEIVRAGEVIPQVSAVVDPVEDTWRMPESCPICGGEVVREGEHHYCTNGTACPAQLERSVEHYCSKAAMDVEGVGEAVAAELVEAGLVESVADLYELDRDDLTALEGWGEQSAENLLAELEDSKDADLASLVYALGIRHVGSERARLLAAEFSLAELRAADAEDLQAVEDVGPEVANSVAAFFDSEDNQRTVDRLLAAGVSPTREAGGDELAGLTLVFTGRVEGYTRRELTDLLERHGADVTASVSGATDYLVVGEAPGARKREQADEHGVETLDEAAFREEILSRVPAADRNGTADRGSES